MRVKRGVASHKKHKKLRAQTKGMSHMRRASIKKAREAVLKALSYAYRDRRTKKRDFRSLWIVRINAGLRETGITYSKFMGLMKKSGVTLDRKILSELAVSQPAAFKAVVEHVTKHQAK
ncbi:MAG TPA: 50S ribosomal protein L20 [Candidatus Dormibacteraeota bacterium]|nr:50S ribosomal protein L20 [Candidatus Dormibacteraeota bacterium]